MTAPVTTELDVLTIMKPMGYRILVRIPRLDSKMKSGLYRPDSSRSLEETASCLGEVVAIGETAYQDNEKFPGDPWCQVGDVIMMRAYSGTRFKIDDQEYRLINDDTVEAVVYDPRRVERV